MARLGLAICFSEACTRVNAARLLLIKAKIERISQEEIARLQTDLERQEKRLERLRKSMGATRQRKAA
jgi:hypothetical protein